MSIKKTALSIKNPNSYLVCAGIKTVENRTWKTDYRGRLYIQSSGTVDKPHIELNDYPYKLVESVLFLDNDCYKDLDIKTVIKSLKRVIDNTKKENPNDSDLQGLTDLYNFYKGQIKLDNYYKGYYEISNYREIWKDKDNLKAFLKSINNDVAIKSLSIIGHVDLVDIQENNKSVWAEDNCYNWIFDNAVLYDKPIINVKGKLRLFDVSHINFIDD